MEHQAKLFMNISKPRILFVIARLNVGGTSQYISEVVEGLQESGFEILVVTGNVQGAEREDDRAQKLPIHRISTLGRRIAPLNDLRSWWALKKVINEFGPNLIYSHTFKAGLLARTIPTPCPRIHAFHGHLLSEPELAGWKRRLVILIERYLARKSARIVTVGEKVALELISENVGTPNQYLSIPPGVIPMKLESRKKAIHQLGIRDDLLTVVWFARMAPVKAPQRAIEVAAKFPNLQVVLAGGGSLLEEMQKVSLENLHVVGWQPAAVVWSVADIAISTSENEGMPVALIEAQLAGVPIIGIDVGSVREVVQDQVTGYVLPAFDSEFMEKVELLASNDAHRANMGKAARNRAMNEYSRAKLIDSHKALFEDFLREF